MKITSTRAREASAPASWTAGWPIVITMAGLALTFWLDRTTGSAPVQHLYYVPILLAASSYGYVGGLLAASAAVVLYHLANPPLAAFAYGESDWVQIVLFVAVGLVAARLVADSRRLHALAMTDDLTGLHNLRSFEARLKTLILDAGRTHAPLALFVLDVDRLKSLNDRHGHLTGAAAVRHVGQLIRETMPPGTVSCRYGGDEFVLALGVCDETRARAVAEDLRAAVRMSAPTLAGTTFAAGTLSISAGIACGRPASPRIDGAEFGGALFGRADAALYVAKANGRDRVHVTGALVQAVTA